MNLKDARLVLNAKCKIVMFTSVIVLWQTTYSSPCRLYLYASLQVMKKYLKLRKHALKTSTSFSSPWRTSHYSANASSFLMNSFMALSKTRVSNARGSPHGTQMPSPGATIKLQMPHPPGLTMWANTPRLPGGGGGDGHCWNWLMHYGHYTVKHTFQRQGLVNIFVYLWTPGDYIRLQELLNLSKSGSGLLSGLHTANLKRPSHGKLKLANSRWQTSKSWQTRTFTRQTHVKSQHAVICSMADLVQWHSRRTVNVNHVNRARVLIGWQLTTHACQSFTRERHKYSQQTHWQTVGDKKNLPLFSPTFSCW